MNPDNHETCSASAVAPHFLHFKLKGDISKAEDTNRNQPSRLNISSRLVQMKYKGLRLFLGLHTLAEVSRSVDSDHSETVKYTYAS